MNQQMILNQILNNPNIKNNPMMQNALQMYRQGDTQGLRTMAENIAKQKGIDIQQLQNQLQSYFK